LRASPPPKPTPKRTSKTFCAIFEIHLLAVLLSG
jgi:hypothetical protein